MLCFQQILCVLFFFLEEYAEIVPIFERVKNNILEPVSKCQSELS